METEWQQYITMCLSNDDHHESIGTLRNGNPSPVPLAHKHVLVTAAQVYGIWAIYESPMYSIEMQHVQLSMRMENPYLAKILTWPEETHHPLRQSG